MATKAEKAYMDIAASLPCQCCFDPGTVELHHVREGQGMAMRAGDFCVIPLCVQCHRSSVGVHGDKTMFRVFKTDEMKMLNQTIGEVFKRVARQ